MSEEQLKAFIEKVQGDTSLQEKLKAAADAEAVAALAKEAGFLFSADLLRKSQVQLSSEELELEMASGGNVLTGSDGPTGAKCATAFVMVCFWRLSITL